MYLQDAAMMPSKVCAPSRKTERQGCAYLPNTRKTQQYTRKYCMHTNQRTEKRLYPQYRPHWSCIQLELSDGGKYAHYGQCKIQVVELCTAYRLQIWYAKLKDYLRSLCNVFTSFTAQTNVYVRVCAPGAAQGAPTKYVFAFIAFTGHALAWQA
jgi:hypothetical protein